MLLLFSSPSFLLKTDHHHHCWRLKKKKKKRHLSNYYKQKKLTAAPGPRVALEDLLGGVPAGLEPLRDEQRRRGHDDGAEGDRPKGRVDVARLGRLGDRRDDAVDLVDGEGSGGRGELGGALGGDVGAAGGRSEGRL